MSNLRLEDPLDLKLATAVMTSDVVEITWPNTIAVTLTITLAGVFQFPKKKMEKAGVHRALSSGGSRICKEVEMRLFSLLAIIGSLCTLTAGCGDEPTGSVVINYRTGLETDSCQGFGIVTVQARLQAPDRDPIIQEARCSNPGFITVSAVPVDVYSIAIEGLDINGEIIYEGAENGISVSEGMATETDLIRLMSLPARMWVVWRFANGFLCGTNGVDLMEVWFYDEDGNPDHVEVNCNLSEVLIENLTNPPYDVRVRGIDNETGEYAFAYDSEDVQLTAGAVTEVTAILDDCPTECVP